MSEFTSDADVHHHQKTVSNTVQILLERERENKKAERAGRIRAEQELRRLQVSAVASGMLPTGTLSASVSQRGANVGAKGGGASVTARSIAFPMRPIGHMQSCFSQRCVCLAC